MDMVAVTCHIFITEDKQSGDNPFGNLRARKAEAGIRVHVRSSLQMEEEDGCPWPSHHQQNRKQSDILGKTEAHSAWIKKDQSDPKDLWAPYFPPLNEDHPRCKWRNLVG
jgi:hypothetical protein